MFNSVSSPTRHYVAICIDEKGEHYARSFYVPPRLDGSFNDSTNAVWYFTNKIEPNALVIGCLSFENYSNITEVKK